MNDDGTNVGYELEPWEEEVSVRRDAMNSGMSSADANAIAAATTNPRPGVDADFMGEGLEEEEEEEKGPLDEAGLPVSQVAPEDFGPNEEVAQPVVQPEAQQAVQPMFQMPNIQNAQQWMQFKNQTMANQGPEEAAEPFGEPPPGAEAPKSMFEQNREAHQKKQDDLFEKQRREQFQNVHGVSKEVSDKRDADRKQREQDFLTNRNEEWARIGP